MTKKISQLPAATAVDTDDEFVINQNGTTKKVTTANSWQLANVNIDGGNIDGTAIGSASASSGAFTTLTASDDVNFDSGTLFVDASTNTVGMGITSGIDSATSLQIVQNSSGSVYPLIIGNANVGVGNAARLFFAPSNNVLGPYIEGYAEEDFSVTANRTGGLAFGTRLNGAASTEAMRIDSSGNVGVGTTSPATSFNVDFSVASGSDAPIISVSRGRADRYAAIGLAAGSNSNLNGLSFYSCLNTDTPTERMRIDHNGNVGIGTTSPSSVSRLTVSGASNTGLVLRNTTSADRLRIFVGDGTGGYANDTNYIASSNTPLIFIAGNPADATAERMRITSSGNVLIGGTSQIQTGKLSVYANSNSDGLAVQSAGGASGTGYSYNCTSTSGFAAFFVTSSGAAGNISCSGTTTTYSTSSDYRLKENIQPLTGALDKVQAMNPVTYDWKAGGQGEGFIAHELQEIAPYAVSGEKDGEQMQGVDYGKLTTLLVGAVKELTAKVEQLEAQLGA